MRPSERRASRLVGILALVAVGVVGLLRVIAGGRTEGPTTLARPTRLDTTATAGPTPPAPAEPPPAAKPSTVTPPAREPASIPASFATAAAEEYRRRARFPRASQPLTDDAEDPIARDREVTPVTSRGPGGAAPVLSVFPAATGFESPETAVLYAELTVGKRRVRARDIRGTVVTEDLTPVGTVEYVDDGTNGDAVADDRVYTATFQPGPEAADVLSRSYLVQVVATTRSRDERLAASSFLYSMPRAHLTGSFADSNPDGSLAVDAEVEVLAPGRFHIEATLYDATGQHKVAWAQAAAEMGPGTQWMRLPFFGLALRERGIDGPYLVRYVALSTTTGMPNAKNRVVQNAYLTSAYSATSFSDREFGDPALLDAAERVERDGLVGGLQRGG